MLLSDLDAFRKTRGNDAIAGPADMKSYLDDPEAYKKRQREKPVVLRERSATPRTTRVENSVSTPKKRQKPASEIDLRRIFMTVGIVVLLFAGLSFAGSFFFSKDGQFGAKTNTAGASKPKPARNDGSSVVAGRGDRKQGNRSVQTEGSSPAAPQAPTIDTESSPLVVINEEKTEEEASGEMPAHAPRPATTAPDTITILEEPGRPTGRVMVDATPWAFVYVDGDSVGITPMPLVASPGTYPITLRNPDFPPFETLVDVIPGRETPLKISLWTLVGALQVDVFPFAKVFIDGQYYNDTPFERPLVVIPGAHTLTLAHPSLGSFESTFEISAGESKSLKFNLNEMK